MKKINGMFGLLLYLALSVQSCVGFDFNPDRDLFLAASFALAVINPLFLLPPALYIGSVAVNEAVNAVHNAYIEGTREINHQKYWNDLMKERYKKELEENRQQFADKAAFLKTDFPKKIKNRIEAILNQEYTNKDTEKSFVIFSTPQSKIFVLQNIEDFFELSQEDKFKIFNPIVYETCSQKINELQAEQKESFKIAFATNNLKNYQKMIDIDTFRDKYMKEFEISASTLKNMSSTELNNKISDVKAAIDRLTIDLSNLKHGFAMEVKQLNHPEELIQERTQKAIEEQGLDAKFRALWSIFVHLSYKQQSKKQPMFAGEGLTEAQGRVELEQEAKKIAPQRLTDEELAQKREELKKLLVKKYAMETKSLEPIVESQQKKEERIRLEDQLARSQQKSWWGNVKSSIGSWFRR